MVFGSMSALGYSIMLFVFLIAVMCFFPKHQRPSRIACVLSFNLHIMVARALVTSVESMIMSKSIYDLSVDPTSFWIVLILTTIASTAVSALIIKLIPSKYLSQLAKKTEYLYFYILIATMANIYMIVNGNVYIHNIDYTWLPLHQIIVALAWLFSTYVVAIMLGVSAAVRVKKEKLEKDFIYKHLVESTSLAFIKVNCTQDKLIRLVIEGEKRSLPEMSYSEYARTTQAKVKQIDNEALLEKIRTPQILIEEYEKGNTILEYTARQEIVGTERWVHTAISLTKEEDTNDVIAVFTLTDEIHDVKVSEHSLKAEAEKDPFVPMLNKKATELYIKEHLAQKKGGALFMIDLDNFKAINDTFGHSYGDTVIKEIADKIIHTFRSDDIIGRIGGDEFIVFIKNNIDRNHITEKANTLLKALHASYTEQGQTIEISSSIGIAIAQDSALTFSELYQMADDAMYKCKKGSKNDFIIYDENKTF